MSFNLFGLIPRRLRRDISYPVDTSGLAPRRFIELYFRQTIALSIIFRYIDKLVSKQAWYDKGYKANIVTYTLAYVHYAIQKQYPDSSLNLKMIWDRQKLPESLEYELMGVAKFVFDHITSEKRPIANVTEWCKKKECWSTLCAKQYTLSDQIRDCLVERSEIKDDERSGKKDQRLVSGIESQSEVVSYGQKYWERMLIWGKEKKLLSDIDISFIMSATKINLGRIPTDKQSQRILNIRARMLDEGFSKS